MVTFPQWSLQLLCLEEKYKVKRIKRKVNFLRTVLNLISLLPFIFIGSAALSQSEHSDTDSSSEEQKLKVMAARNNEINALLAKAVSLYKHKEFEQTVTVLNQVIRLDPQNAPAHFSLGITLEAMHDWSGAAEHYATAHEIDPGNNEYQQALLSLKDKSEKGREKELEKQKQSAMSAEASEAFKQQRYEEALSLYQSLEKESPKLAFVKYNIGTIYIIFKKPNDALNYYKEAHKLEPGNKQYADSLEKLEQSIKQIENEKKVEKASPEKKNNHEERLTDQSAKRRFYRIVD